MAIYSMVKNNTFNGIPLPSIAMLREDGEVEMLKQFGYEDFKGHNRFWKTSRTREDDLDEGRGNGEKDAKVCRRSKRENDNAAGGRIFYAGGVRTA